MTFRKTGKEVANLPQNIRVKPVNVTWFQRRITKLWSPTPTAEETMKETRKTAHSSLAPQVEVFTHLGHHDKVQVQMAAIMVAILATAFFAPAL